MANEVEFKELDIETARKLAKIWTEKLGECCCEKIDVVAGVYRGKNPTSDVDLLCMVKDEKALEELKPVKKDSLRFVYADPDEKGEPRKVEVWYCNSEKYPLYLWYRRTPKERFIKLASRAKAKGMRLSWKEGLIDSGGKLITSNPTEIEKILGGEA